MLIAQITDAHIVEKNKHWLSEPATATAERLSRVIDYINALNPLPDVVFFTGDATDEGTQEAYYYFFELMAPLKVPLYVLPGNHDRREQMRKTFAHTGYVSASGFIHYAINHYPVRLIALDTHVEGEGYGHLCEERFHWLQKTLDEESDKPTLIFMHHPPVMVGSKVFDRIACSIPSSFEDFIREKNNVIGILAGHYHHLCVASFGGKVCFIAPSVAPVHHFAHPQDEQMTAIELEDPAVTLHRWQNGRLVSHVMRIKEKYHRIDWAMIQKKRLEESK